MNFSKKIISVASMALVFSGLPTSGKVLSADSEINLPSGSTDKKYTLDISPDLVSKGVIHKVTYSDTLGGLALRYYGDASKWDTTIASDPRNNDHIYERETPKHTYVYDNIRYGDTLWIPQLNSVSWILYNPTETTFGEIVENLYKCNNVNDYKKLTELLTTFNHHASDYIHTDVVKLPREIFSDSHIVEYNERTLYQLCKKVYGSVEYVSKIAKLNNLSENCTLYPNMILHLPNLPSSPNVVVKENSEKLT